MRNVRLSGLANSIILEGEIRTIGSLNKFDLDPINPGDYFHAHEKTPYTKFVIDPTINCQAVLAPEAASAHFICDL